MQVSSGKTTPMQAGGALMLGGEQDCYGGCTDASQAFYGLMDEVCIMVSVSLSHFAEAASGRCTCMAGIKTPSGVEAAVGLSRLPPYRILQRHPLEPPHSCNVQSWLAIRP